MSNRNLLVLAIAAGAMIFLAAVSSQISKIGEKAPASAGPTFLIQGLDPDQVAKITIKGGTDEVTLTRRGANFVVTNKDSCPAAVSEINKLITTCLNVKTAELYTDNPANFNDLGVNEDDARIVVKFYKPDSSLLTGFIIGKQREKGSVGYIRRVDDNKVYIMAAQVPWIKKSPIEYVDQQLTNVKREDIELVTVGDLNGTYVLKPGADSKTVILENLPEGKKLNEPTAIAVFNALAELKFDDVNSEATHRNLKYDRRYICRLKNSAIYTIRLAKEGDNWFAKCDAQFMDKTPVTKTQGEVESEEELKKKETKLLARDVAEEFAEKHKGWVYQIPANMAENLIKPLSALVEDIKAPNVSEPNEVSDENLTEELEIPEKPL